MKILSANVLENCIEGEFTYIYILDSPWTEQRILALADIGDLKYYKSFPKPMFQLTCADGTFVKAVQGANECRVIFRRGFNDADKRRFEALCFGKCLADI